MNNPKPLGMKAYGSIPHLPGSRMGPADHAIHTGQLEICTVKCRKGDTIIVQEKLDGSCVAALRLGDSIYALTRSGYLAETSKYEQHHLWKDWVAKHAKRFLAVLVDGERMCGEWLAQAHGTRYVLPYEPFAPFDLMLQHERLPYAEFKRHALRGSFTPPATLSYDEQPVSIEAALAELNTYGYHGAIDPAEGCVWRVEHNGNVDFLAKYVRPDKIDGKYLPEMSGKPAVWNWRPNV